jgi:hypothetical protein
MRTGEMLLAIMEIISVFFLFGRLETKENECKEEGLKEESMSKMKERKKRARENMRE